MALKKISTKHWIFALGTILTVIWAVNGPRPFWMAIAGFGFWLSFWNISKDYGWWGVIGYFAFGLGFLIGAMINWTLSLTIPWQIRLIVSILVGFAAFDAIKRWDVEKQVNRWWTLATPLGLWIGFGLLNEGNLQDDSGLVVPIGIGVGMVVRKISPWLRKLRWEKEIEPKGVDKNVE